MPKKKTLDEDKIKKMLDLLASSHGKYLYESLSKSNPNDTFKCLVISGLYDCLVRLNNLERALDRIPLFRRLFEHSTKDK